MPPAPDPFPPLANFSLPHWQRPKEFVRRLASRCCQIVLGYTSHPYVSRPGTTLVFAPHQDDETLGCGAVIARKRNDGLPVHVVFLTDGSASHPHHPLLTSAHLSAIRLQESRQVLSTLGVDSACVHFFNEGDGTLDRLPPARRAMLVARIAALLRALDPEEIFLPCNADGSSEHQAAFSFVVEAAELTEARAMIWEYPVWLWWNPLTLLARLVHTPGRYQAATEDFLPVKRRALGFYRSQLQPLPPEREAALPRDLLRLIDTEREYFFRFTAGTSRSHAPIHPII